MTKPEGCTLEDMTDAWMYVRFVSFVFTNGFTKESRNVFVQDYVLFKSTFQSVMNIVLRVVTSGSNSTYLQCSHHYSASPLKDLFIRPVRVFFLNFGGNDVVVAEKDDADS